MNKQIITEKYAYWTEKAAMLFLSEGLQTEELMEKALSMIIMEICFIKAVF